MRSGHALHGITGTWTMAEWASVHESFHRLCVQATAMSGHKNRCVSSWATTLPTNHPCPALASQHAMPPLYHSPAELEGVKVGPHPQLVHHSIQRRHHLPCQCLPLGCIHSPGAALLCTQAVADVAGLPHGTDCCLDSCKGGLQDEGLVAIRWRLCI